jgi:uncharacterized membrane protein
MAKRHRSISKAERRKREMERLREKRTKTLKTIAGVVIVIALVAIAAFAISKGGSRGPEPSEDITTTDSGNLQIQESAVTNEAKFYSFDSNGVKVRFFAVRGSDGDAHVAIDACDVCYSEKKGYRQSGNDMVCNNCGNRYPTNSIGTENKQGGCWPSYIPINLSGGMVEITSKDLNNKRFMFK